MILFPVLLFAALVLILNGHPQFRVNERDDWRYQTGLAFVVTGVIAVAAIEVLSVFSALTQKTVGVTWGALLCVALSVWFFGYRKTQILPSISGFSGLFLGLLSGIFFLVIITSVVALLAPPNTWDSLTYHMSRVAHWVQNRSVGHYPTNILRQLYHAPGAEFMILQAQLLSGGDRFANMIQWSFYIGCVLTSSLLTKQFGFDRWAQLLTAVFASTLPMAILQASSTQNDLAASFWLLAAVVFLLRLQNQFNWTDACGAGAGIGLAFLTKSLSYVYIIPFIAWFAWACVRNRQWGKLSKTAALIAALVIVINLGHWSRNFVLFHHPLGPIKTIDLTNEKFGVRPVLSNIIRGAASHASFPIIGINHELTKWIYAFHRSLGMDANDPKTTYDPNFGKFQIRPLHAHEDSASNPIHFWLIVICGIIALRRRETRKEPKFIFYLASVIAAFLLICIIFKWQVWISRLQLPLFFFWAPVAGSVLSLMKAKSVSGAVAVFLLVSSLYSAFFNFSRSFFKWPFVDNMPPTVFEAGRDMLYMNNGANIVKLSYLLATKHIESKRYKNVGLIVHEDDWEYPYWAILQANRNAIRIEHIEVANISSKIKRKPFRPDVVIASKPTDGQIRRYEAEYGSGEQMGILWVFGR